MLLRRVDAVRLPMSMAAADFIPGGMSGRLSISIPLSPMLTLLLERENCNRKGPRGHCGVLLLQVVSQLPYERRFLSLLETILFPTWDHPTLTPRALNALEATDVVEREPSLPNFRA